MHTYRAHQDISVLSDQLEVPGLGFLAVNAFVIHAAQPVVADTGLGLPDRDLVAALAEVIDPADVRWIWLTHPDRDHTGGLFALLDAAPQARVVTTFTGAGIMSTEHPLPMDRIYLLNPGQSLDVGDRRLTGFRPPLFDNPATVGILDTSTGTCLSSDCFGAPLPTSELASAHDAAAADPASCVRRSCCGPPWTAHGCTVSIQPDTRRRFSHCATSAPPSSSVLTCPRSPATPTPFSLPCSMHPLPRCSPDRTRPRSRRCCATFSPRRTPARSQRQTRELVGSEFSPPSWGLLTFASMRSAARRPAGGGRRAGSVSE